MAPKKSIQEKFRKLTDVEHVLLRPGMYVGSTKPKEEAVWLLTDVPIDPDAPEDEASPVETKKALRMRDVTYNPAFMKLFDEIVSNAVDEHRRNPKQLNKIRVLVSTAEGTIAVADNGGIPVVRHPEHDEWVPEMIFSNLKAGSNFNDDEDRLVAGTNGVGATLTNIFSTRFKVETCDRINEYSQVFTENMTKREPARVTPATKKRGYTRITYTPELSRFGLDCIDATHTALMRKRCLDLAATNPALSINFKVSDGRSVVEDEYQFASFRDYCALYAEPLIYEEVGSWKVAFAPSEGSFTQASFVNAVETKDGGTHIESILWPIINWIREKLRKKKIEVKPAEIRNHFFVVTCCDVVNPAFSSQTKEKLITEARDFGSKFEASEKTLKAVYSSEIVSRILDWAAEKNRADERKKLRELNKLVDRKKLLKLIDAKKTGDRSLCSLAIFEGDSATSAFRKYRDPTTQGAFPLRGKVLNVAGLPASKVIANAEIQALLVALGLKMGEPPTDLRYGRVMIYADADPDGDSITALLINFFGRYWPELFAEHRIVRVMTPLVVAKKGGQELSFYTAVEFDAWTADVGAGISKWNVSYKKGLAALDSLQYEDIIKRPRMFVLTAGTDMLGALDCWFGGDVGARKVKILGSENSEEAD